MKELLEFWLHIRGTFGFLSASFERSSCDKRIVSRRQLCPAFVFPVQIVDKCLGFSQLDWPNEHRGDELAEMLKPCSKSESEMNQRVSIL